MTDRNITLLKSKGPPHPLRSPLSVNNLYKTDVKLGLSILYRMQLGINLECASPRTEAFVSQLLNDLWFFFNFYTDVRSEIFEGYKNSYDGSPFGSLLILFVLDKHDTDTEEPARVSVIQDQLGKGN